MKMTLRQMHPKHFMTDELPHIDVCLVLKKEQGALAVLPLDGHVD